MLIGPKGQWRMRQTDIAIIGGGLAGSSAAAMLGRAGISTILIDLHRVYPPDFRCEKIGGVQIDILRKMGLYDAVKRASTLDGHAWTARLGRMLDNKPSDQHGILYDDLVNTMRREIPAAVDFIEGKVTSVSTSSERQTITLSTGEEISARLVVLANGLNIGLRDTLGVSREIVSPCHSITIGFNATPVGRDKFEFPALTYFTENSASLVSYLSLFPIGGKMRANLMVYRQMDDPWLSRMRHSPETTIHEVMPNLRSLSGDFTVEGPVKIRPADLYVTHGHRQAGIVLVGDAFATSCPAAGTGTYKVYTDVERLCNRYIPQWLATRGMSAAKTAQFYDDPEKRACDEFSRSLAYSLRAMSIDTGLIWHVRRWMRFAVRFGLGAIRNIRETLTTRRIANS